MATQPRLTPGTLINVNGTHVPGVGRVTQALVDLVAPGGDYFTVEPVHAQDAALAGQWFDAAAWSLVGATVVEEPTAAPANPLFALWSVEADGTPDEEAWDPWGDRDPLAYVDEPDAAAVLGPWCTVVDQDTERMVWAGDVTAVLEAYVAGVERGLGYAAGVLRQWEGEGTALITAVAKAREFAAEETAGEYGRELAQGWCAPDPDTSRSMARMPEQVRSNIGGAAAEAGLAGEASRLAEMILTHAGLTS